MEAFETFEHAGCVVELHQDMDPQSPADWDALGTMAVIDRDKQYTGFERTDSTASEAVRDRESVALALRYLRMSGVIAIPFDIAEHGSQARIVECREDDDSCDGFIYTTREQCDKLGVPFEEGETQDALRSELREWGAWIEGNVIGYIVKRNGGTVDSCWGFYPDAPQDGSSDEWEYVREQARAMAEYEQEESESAAAMDVATL